ncbi:glycerol-3-phosphate 1-O-acyltransferase PlsY [Gemmiger sp.]|uniref:glycerol-3-phosphate 1-O-acyltransferase PlsY n=1 Tax=Gemmiger sp. TaxID=2049027 RepID=UPI002A759DE1|nr:glycerol-3-phosphate 1-O-acyltransferase PlsY [Gemmiger sp.]MDY2695021.1 glycerol-3-phosphate 1-O-acyltransferase PlsY [Gemmiger sp.]MDY6007333.1 glycerol-3-phosphate 1-O-acyltransferase PlsY [Gemmiger sp.]
MNILRILAACLLTALSGYLLGSILFGVLISKVLYNDDVRSHGSGNAGMTNVLRTYGKLAAVLTTLGDVGKSVAAVRLGRLLFTALLGGQTALDPVCGAYLAAIFCMIGHSRPLFFGFKGGKGVLVGAGAALATEPLVCAVLLGIFLVEFAITRIVSLGSIIIAALYPVATLIHLLAHGADAATVAFSTVCCAIMAAMVIWLHRSNIERLKNGTEYRFGEKKNSSK